MPTGSINVSASIEAVIHKSLKNVLQTVADEYGIVVNSVSVEWLDGTRRVGKDSGNPMLVKLSIESTSRY